MRSRFLWERLLVLAFIAASWALGWWGVPVVAALAAWPRGARWSPGKLAALAVEAWVWLLAFDALWGRLGAVSHMVGGAMQLPGFVLMIVALMFAGLLAWSAAAVVEGISSRPG